MPRIKDKPVELDEAKFIDWLLEVYYYRFMDQGVAPARTPFMLANTDARVGQEFLSQVRTQLVRFDLTFPLTKLPTLFAQACRQVSTRPTSATPVPAIPLSIVDTKPKQP